LILAAVQAAGYTAFPGLASPIPGNLSFQLVQLNAAGKGDQGCFIFRKRLQQARTGPVRLKASPRFSPSPAMIRVPLPLPLPVPIPVPVPLLLPCPLSAARIAGLRATVVLLLILLMKSKLLRLKMSLLGTVLGLLFSLIFLVSSGVLVLVAGGAVAYALQQRKAAST
jgi:hypothetical protein